MFSKPRLFVGLLGLMLGMVMMGASKAAEESATSKQRFFELRTYTTAEGRLDALNARFRDHTNALFKKHGIEIIGFWTPTEGPKSKNTLIYILAYPSKEAAKNPGRHSRPTRSG
jgi:hypothetical protein